ncbi:sensor histidine kinase [Rhodovibrionaceae bacterium A322]
MVTPLVSNEDKQAKSGTSGAPSPVKNPSSARPHSANQNCNDKQVFAWSCNHDLRLTDLDPIAASRLGLPPQSLIGLSLLALSQGALAMTPKELKQGLETDTDFQWDSSLLAKALGSQSSFEDLVVVVRDSQNRPLFGSLSGHPVHHSENGSFLGYRGKGRLSHKAPSLSKEREDAPYVYANLSDKGLLPTQDNPLDNLTQELEVAVLENAQLRYLLQHLQEDAPKANDNRAFDADGAGQESKESEPSALARLAHELRSPLNAIQGYSELILSAPQGDLPDTYGRYLESVLNATRHLDELISSLELPDLQSEPDAEPNLSLDLSPIDLKELMEELSGLTRLQAHKAEVDASGLSLKGSFWVYGHRRSLFQILLNLITNAIKFTPAGGAIGLEVHPKGRDYLNLTIWDTGQGIGPEEQDRIFEDGYRSLREHSGEAIPGQGLGLAIVTDLLAKMDLEISLTSAPDQGSRFSFDLPLVLGGSVTKDALSLDEKAALTQGQRGGVGRDDATPKGNRAKPSSPPSLVVIADD